MSIEIVQVGADALEHWADVPIRFRVETVLEVEELDDGLGGLALVERPVATPYIKDYDAVENDRPARWTRFDLSHWGFFHAIEDGAVGGCAAVAGRSPAVHLLGGRTDFAHLWDLRVRPERRGEGIGARLFTRAVEFARAEGYRQLRVETQNINVGACRFYATRGCRLARVDRTAYWGVPHAERETMLIWSLDL